MRFVLLRNYAEGVEPAPGSWREFDADTPAALRAALAATLGELLGPGDQAVLKVRRAGDDWLHISSRPGYWLQGTTLRLHLPSAETARLLFAQARDALEAAARFDQQLAGLAGFAARAVDRARDQD